eukprot:3446317-Prymnesium_polylepis.1
MDQISGMDLGLRRAKEVPEDFGSPGAGEGYFVYLELPGRPGVRCKKHTGAGEELSRQPRTPRPRRSKGSRKPSGAGECHGFYLELPGRPG